MTVTECCIKGCCYKSPDPTISKDNLKTLFKVPNEGTIEREKWKDIVEEHTKEKLRKRKFLYVCENHFEDKCFLRNKIEIFRDGKSETVPRKRIRLLPDSLPTKFPTNSITEAAQKSSPNKRPFITPPKLPPPNRENNASDESPTYNVLNLIDDWNKCELIYTQSWEYVRVPEGVQFLYYLHSEPSNWRGVLVRNDLTVQSIVQGRNTKYKTKVSCISCLNDLLSVTQELSALQVCEGNNGQFCPMGLYIKKSTRKCNRCFDCQKKHRSAHEKLRRRKIRNKNKSVNGKQVQENLKQNISLFKISKLKQVVKNLQKKLEGEKEKLAGVNEEFLKHSSVQKLPKKMQKSLRAYWELSKRNDKKSMRCTKGWLLECLLHRIKSQKAYLQLREHNLLPPSGLNTLNKYTKPKPSAKKTKIAHLSEDKVDENKKNCQENESTRKPLERRENVKEKL